MMITNVTSLNSLKKKKRNINGKFKKGEVEQEQVNNI